MIHTDSRSLEWINHIAILYPTLNKSLIEKTIRAFSLLESLVRSGCPLCFKGGTATMLHLNSSRRLSIDIDIICPPGTEITQYVHRFAEEYGFTDIQLNERRSIHNVPKSHAKFFYEVSYVTNSNTDKILLDVLFEELHYSEVVKLPIQSPFLKVFGQEVMVDVPSIYDILGDKLTAFAPHTTGVPFDKGMRDCSGDVIKQMFDISSLFDIIDNMEPVAKTFHKFVLVGLGYRGKTDMGEDDVLRDAIDTALCLCLRGVYKPEMFMRLKDGVKRLYNTIHCCKYSLEYAIVDAAKAAYCAALILRKQKDIVRYSPLLNTTLIKVNIGSLLPSKLNKLKKTHPEAFFYWSKVEELLSS
ncbi:MAG: nucleotidyl transferase AbiEii/AbiGii toxin family protein [Bacteroidales bacterium]|nr:nucleotidyl transferase AbiEii/AbiGii toxin family protein [Bacteroidales bacterium]